MGTTHVPWEPTNAPEVDLNDFVRIELLCVNTSAHFQKNVLVQRRVAVAPLRPSTWFAWLPVQGAAILRSIPCRL